MQHAPRIISGHLKMERPVGHNRPNRGSTIHFAHKRTVGPRLRLLFYTSELLRAPNHAMALLERDKCAGGTSEIHKTLWIQADKYLSN